MTPATQKAIEALRRIAGKTCAVVPDCKGSLTAEKFWCSRCIARAALASLEAEHAAPHEQERECPNCGHGTCAAWLFCPHCAQTLAPHTIPPAEQQACVPLGEPGGGRECCNFFRGPVPICDECREIMKSFAGITESDIERHQRFQEEVRKSAEELRRCVPLGEIKEALNSTETKHAENK